MSERVGLEDAYVKKAQEILQSDPKNVGVIVSDSQGFCMTAAGSYFLSDAAASLTALTEAARALNSQSNDQDVPVIQIVTDTTEVLISSDRGYHTAIARSASRD